MIIPLLFFMPRICYHVQMDRLTAEQRHKCMSHIKSKDTQIELMMRKALREHGYGYRKHYKALPGTPDIVLTKYKICVFCDSAYFHGRDWEQLQEQLKRGKNADFWIKKIGRNIQKDDEVNRALFGAGWTVLRFWDTEIKKNLDGCIKVIEETIMEKKIEVD